MSMAMCDCGRFVDTDEEPECYDFGDKCLCEGCRDEIYDAMTEAQQAEHEKRIYG